MHTTMKTTSGIIAMSVLAIAATGFLSVASADSESSPQLIHVALEHWSLPDTASVEPDANSQANSHCIETTSNAQSDCRTDANPAAVVQSSLRAAEGAGGNPVHVDSSANGAPTSHTICADKTGDQLRLCMQTLPLLQTVSWVYH